MTSVQGRDDSSCESASSPMTNPPPRYRSVPYWNFNLDANLCNLDPNGDVVGSYAGERILRGSQPHLDYIDGHIDHETEHAVLFYRQWQRLKANRLSMLTSSEDYLTGLFRDLGHTTPADLAVLEDNIGIGMELDKTLSFVGEGLRRMQAMRHRARHQLQRAAEKLHEIEQRDGYAWNGQPHAAAEEEPDDDNDGLMKDTSQAAGNMRISRSSFPEWDTAGQGKQA